MIDVGEVGLVTVFHLNLHYSSVEVEDRPAIMTRCYWPLLDLISTGGGIAVEATAETLEAIVDIDVRWVSELRSLIEAGKCEFVGSGFAQVVGPLVPAAVSEANLLHGNQVYEGLLGVHPSVAYVNEQAFSSGLVPHYLEAGYRAIIMEVNNPARAHDWPREVRLLPQVALGTEGTSIPVIWNDSIGFQKFQSYAHGELSLDEHISFLREQARGNAPSVFPLYGSDVETFNYRPGRFTTELPIASDGEWGRIGELFARVGDTDGLKLCLPSEILGLGEHPMGGHELELGTAQIPIPVKKQPKYNVTRWALTGRDDVRLNTVCWQLFHQMSAFPIADVNWRELCSFWASDFRTHIAPGRWEALWERIDRLRLVIRESSRGPEPSRTGEAALRPRVVQRGPQWTIEEDGRWIDVIGPISARLNRRRGLAFDQLRLGGPQEPSVLGTVPHGFYDDIHFGADFYTGLTVVEIPGRRKVTDLDWMEASIEERNDAFSIVGRLKTDLGLITKRITFAHSPARVVLHYEFDWLALPPATIRTATVTLNPEVFHRDSLFYRTHNGGSSAETYRLLGLPVDHDQSVSSLVSSSHTLGATGGWVELGDDRRAIRVTVDRAVSAAMPLVFYRSIGETFLYRLHWSVCEFDDTTRPDDRLAPREVRVIISAGEPRDHSHGDS